MINSMLIGAMAQRGLPRLPAPVNNSRAVSQARTANQTALRDLNTQYLTNLNSYSQQAGIPNPTGLPSLTISPNSQTQVDPNRILLGGGMMGDPNYYVNQKYGNDRPVPPGHKGFPAPQQSQILIPNNVHNDNRPDLLGGEGFPGQQPNYGQDPYAPLTELPTYNPYPTQPAAGAGAGGGQASGPFDYNTIDHANIPGVLQERGQLGLPGYQQLVDFGHTEENLRKVFQGLPDVARTPELNAYMRDNALGILNTKGPFDLRTMDHGNIPDVLRQQGTLTQAGYNQLVEHGHPETLLRMSIRDAGIDVGSNLGNYFDKNPMGILAQREFERAPVNPLLQPGLRTGGKAYRLSQDELNTAIDAAPFLFEDNKMLKHGYSFEPREGLVLVASGSYTGGGEDGNTDGTVNIYGPSNPQTGQGPGGPINQIGNNPFGETTSTPITPVNPGSGTSGPGTSGPVDSGSATGEGNNADPFADLPPYVAPQAPIYQAPNYTFNVPDPAAGPSYQMFGARGSSVPGVKIRRSEARRRLSNTLGTGFFNRSTSPSLRISNLNV